jgi:hypothetical protein
MDSVIAVKKVPLQWAAVALTAICEQIENGENIDNALLTQFNETKLDIAEAIDRRKSFKRYLEMMIDHCKAGKNEISEQQKRFEAVLESLKEKTKAIIEENPNVPYVDSFGKKLSLVNSGNPKLELKIPLTASKTVSHIIDKEQCDFFGVDPKYIKQVSYLTLDTELLKSDLKAGEKLEWAEIIFNKQLRGL